MEWALGGPVPGSFFVVTGAWLRYAGGMFWKKTWEPEAVLALVGGILAAFFFGNVAVGLLQQAKVAGFREENSLGSVLLATLSFQGAAVVLGTAFLRFHESSWREVLGGTRWRRCLTLALLLLLAITPVMLAAKWLSECLLLKLHFSVVDQKAVELILSAKNPWLSAYLVFFAIALAPLGEEFLFRGLLFSIAKHFGRPKLGWWGVSALFALIHLNAPTFLPLLILALGLTWLCEKTGGLLAPILAHSLFNAANLLLLALAEKFGPAAS